MDGWLLLVGRLEEIKTPGMSGTQTNTTAVPPSTSCFLLVPDAVLEVCQGSKVAPHSSQAGQNLKEETRMRRRESSRRRRRRTVSLRSVTTSPPFQLPNYFIDCPVILSFTWNKEEIWGDRFTLVKPFDCRDWGAVEEERAKWNFRTCPVSLCSSGSSHLSQGRCFSKTQVWAQFYFWSPWEACRSLFFGNFNYSF